jgi:hypothetical protein
MKMHASMHNLVLQQLSMLLALSDTCRGSDIIRDEVIGKGSSAEVYKVITLGGTKLAVKRCAVARTHYLQHQVCPDVRLSKQLADLAMSSCRPHVTWQCCRMTEPENRHANGAAQLFQDEVQVLATLDHPNITRCAGFSVSSTWQLTAGPRRAAHACPSHPTPAPSMYWTGCPQAAGRV